MRFYSNHGPRKAVAPKQKTPRQEPGRFKSFFGTNGLFNLPVQRMAPQISVEFLLLDTALLLLLVSRGHIARRPLAFSAGFRAFQYDVFPCHDFENC